MKYNMACKKSLWFIVMVINTAILSNIYQIDQDFVLKKSSLATC